VLHLNFDTERVSANRFFVCPFWWLLDSTLNQVIKTSSSITVTLSATKHAVEKASLNNFTDESTNLHMEAT
jgi:hypothetical protein